MSDDIIYGSPNNPITASQVNLLYVLVRDLKKYSYNPIEVQELRRWLDSDEVLSLSSLDASKEVLRLKAIKRDLLSKLKTDRVVSIHSGKTTLSSIKRVQKSSQSAEPQKDFRVFMRNGLWVWRCIHPKHSRVVTPRSGMPTAADAHRMLNKHITDAHTEHVCKRGHWLIRPNLIPGEAKKGKLGCRSCNNAISARTSGRIGKSEADVQAAADAYYESRGFKVTRLANPKPEWKYLDPSDFPHLSGTD